MTASCARCQRPVSSAIADGLCPACLLDVTLSLEPAAPATEIAPDGTGAFGHFTLAGEIGRGGMGVVYRARENATGRTVALKVIAPALLATPDALTRFANEARSAASLDHPHILPVYEVGEHDALPYFSMKLATGGSLAQHLAHFTGDPRRAASLLASVARAVHHAHTRRVLHRDLKPGNILLDEHDQPFVADFGLARWLETGAPLSASLALLGTPHYVAPEQSSGDHTAGPAADVFSLGAIFYELLTGHPAFAGATLIETLRQSAEGRPTPPRARDARVPRDLEVICLQCLQPDPAARYASAEALAIDLERWLAGRTILARPAGAGQQLWRWAKRNPVPATLAASLIVVLAATATYATRTSLLIARERDRAESERQRATVAEQAALRDLRASYLGQAAALRRTGRAGQRFDALAALRSAAAIRPGADLRSEAAAALALVDLRLDRDHAVRTGLTRARFDPTLTHYALAVGAEGAVSFRRRADDVEIIQLPAPTPAAGVTSISPFSADGRFVAVRHGALLRVWEVATARLILERAALPTGNFHPLMDFDVTFTPDSSAVVFGVPGGIEFVASAHGKTLRTFATPQRPAVLSFSPDGRTLAWSAVRANTLQLLDSATGESRGTLTQPEAIYSVAWRGDGRTLATGGFDYQVRLWNSATLALEATLSGLRQEPTQLAFHPDGGLLASVSSDRATTLWDTRRPGPPVVTMPAVGSEPILQFSPDGTRLVAGEWDSPLHELQLSAPPVWRAWSATESRGRAGLYAGVRFSPDGRWLVTSAFSGVRLRDARNGAEVAFLPTTDAKAETSAVFTADGRALLISNRATGLCRVPLSVAADGAVQLGAPETLATSAQPLLLQSLTPDGHIAALSGYPEGGAHLLRLGESATFFSLPDEPEAWNVELSPDQRWLAVAHFGLARSKGVDVRIYEPARPADTARAVVAEIPVGPGGMATFSPDGRWLATTGAAGAALWHTGTWQPGPALPAEFDASFLRFSPDGRLLAGAVKERIVLVDPATATIICTLDAPASPGNGARLTFSTDGQQLAVLSGNGALAVWDLAALRAGLRELGLDWP